MLHATSAQSSTPDAVTGPASVDKMDTRDIEKRIEDIDESLTRDTSSPAILTDSPRDNDTRLAQSMSETALSPAPPHIWPIEREDTQRVRESECSQLVGKGANNFKDTAEFIIFIPTTWQ